METIQTSQVHFEAAAAFCFANKSPKPPPAGGATGVLTTGAAGGSFFSAGLAPKPVNDGVALVVFASFDGIPKVNFGAEFDSVLDSSDDPFGALGFGDSQARHFKADVSLETIQISQVHFEAAAAFCLANRSPKPPLDGALEGALDVGLGVSFAGSETPKTNDGFAADSVLAGAFGLGVSHAAHLSAVFSFEIIQTSHDHRSLFALDAFCFAMKSPKPLDFVSAVTFGGASEVLFSTPNLKEGAVEDGAGAEDFGAFGFGDSQAAHFRADLSLDTIQISHVHFEAADAFCFASKSPKPLVVGAADFTGDFGFSSILDIFGDSDF